MIGVRDPTPASRLALECAQRRLSVGREQAAVGSPIMVVEQLRQGDQGHVGQESAGIAKARGVEFEVVQLRRPKGFRAAAEAFGHRALLCLGNRFRRLVKDDERYASTPADPTSSRLPVSWSNRPREWLQVHNRLWAIAWMCTRAGSAGPAGSG
jgi:hypothetical protein